MPRVPVTVPSAFSVVCPMATDALFSMLFISLALRSKKVHLFILKKRKEKEKKKKRKRKEKEGEKRRKEKKEKGKKMRAQPAQRRAARLGGHVHPAVRGTGNFRPFLLFRDPPGPVWRALPLAVGDVQ